MFFRREKAPLITFDDRLDELKKSGFTVANESSGKARVSKLGCAAVLSDNGSGEPIVDKAGIVVGNEIGFMVHAGYQMFFATPGGRRQPALAEHLKALHDFEEDLREALGLVSLYNVALGTRADRHMYDRVADRDFGVKKAAWD